MSDCYEISGWARLRWRTAQSRIRQRTTLMSSGSPYWADSSTAAMRRATPPYVVRVCYCEAFPVMWRWDARPVKQYSTSFWACPAGSRHDFHTPILAPIATSTNEGGAIWIPQQSGRWVIGLRAHNPSAARTEPRQHRAYMLRASKETTAWRLGWPSRSSGDMLEAGILYRADAAC